MPEPWKGQSSDLKVVMALGAEFERLAMRERRDQRWSVMRLGRRTLIVATLGALLAAGGVAAATGLLPIGTKIFSGSLPLESLHTIVARGEAPVAGRWEMTYYRSGRLTDQRTGKVLQRAGLPSLAIRLLDPPSAPSGIGGSADFRKWPGFSGMELPVLISDGSAELLAFGAAPERATAVEVRFRDGRRIRAATIDGPHSVDMDFWLVPLSRGQANTRGRNVRWLDERRGTAGRPLRMPVPKRGWFRTPVERTETPR